jgi:mRNA interferase MazF
MLRGDIHLINLDPVRGNEANKQRPAVIVSNDRANAAAQRLQRGIITVVPITSNVTRLYPFQTLLPADRTGLPRDSKAQAEQIHSVSIERVGAALGRLPADLLTHLDDAIRIHLDL